MGTTFVRRDEIDFVSSIRSGPQIRSKKTRIAGRKISRINNLENFLHKILITKGLQLKSQQSIT